MATPNLVSIDMSQEDIDFVVNSLKAIREKMPFLISLTPEERQQHAKMGDGNLPFVLKSYDYTQSNPEFTPQFIDVVEYGKDVKGSRDLDLIGRLFGQFLSDVKDTRLVSGGEAYLVGLTHYGFVKHAAKAGARGAKKIYEDMKKRFQGGRRKSSHEPDQNGVVNTPDNTSEE